MKNTIGRLIKSGKPKKWYKYIRHYGRRKSEIHSYNPMTFRFRKWEGKAIFTYKYPNYDLPF